MDALHRFGSAHTRQKLEIIGKYLPAYTTALKNTAYVTHYVDAFAGTGLCYIRAGNGRLLIPGSAKIAMDCMPPFQKIVFVEMSLHRVRALERMRDSAPSREILVIRGDANVAIPDYLSRLMAYEDRAIVFLDPFGMELEWSTLARIAATKLADVWYLFPLLGLYRQATRDSADIDADKAAALTRILGTEEWRTAFYAQPAQRALFGEQSDIRVSDVPQMLAWVKSRLEIIFAGVAKPKVLYQTTESGKQGAPMFALFFAVSNPAPVAKGLALRIAEGILKQE